MGYTIEPGTNCELVVKGKTFDFVQPVKINDPSFQFQLNDGAKQSILRSSGLNKHLFGNVLTANDTSIEASLLFTYRFRPMNNASKLGFPLLLPQFKFNSVSKVEFTKHNHVYQCTNV